MMKLAVHEIFETVQGEGLYTGLPCLFIRLSGCSVGCSWCDTNNSVSIGTYNYSQIRDVINTSRKRNVVFTGGEPFDQPSFIPVLEKLLGFDDGVRPYVNIHVETSGHTISDMQKLRDIARFSGRRLFVTFSPKLFREDFNEAAAQAMSYLKVYSGQLKIVYTGTESDRTKLSILTLEDVSNAVLKYVQFEDSLKDKAGHLSQLLKDEWFHDNFRVSPRLHNQLGVK